MHIALYRCVLLTPNSNNDQKFESLIKLVTNEGYQLHPEVLNAITIKKLSLEEVYAAIRSEIRRRRLLKINSLNITLKDLSLENVSVIKKSGVIAFTIVNMSSEHVEPITPSQLGYLFRDRYHKFFNIWQERMTKVQLYKLNAVSSKFKGERTVIGLIASKKGGFIILEDLNGFVRISVRDRNMYSELIPGTFISCKVINEGDVEMVGFEDLDIPDHQSKQISYDITIAFLSDLLLGNKKTDVDKLIGAFRKLDRTGVSAVIIGGNIIDRNSLIKGGFTSADGYLVLKDLIKLLPTNVIKILIPGELDAQRLSLPQPPIGDKVLGEISSLEGVHSMGNPSMVNINGFNLLLYHGQGISDIVHYTKIRNAALLARKMLKVRHLAPVYGCHTPILSTDHDSLVIEKTPDVFLVGHTGIASDTLYRNTLLVTAPMWNTDGGAAAIINLNGYTVSWIKS